MKTFWARLLVSGMMLLVVTSCTYAQPAVTGQAILPTDNLLPDDAVMTVQIQDTSLADAPAKTAGETVIQTKGEKLPIEFRVAYDAAAINKQHSYALSIRIEDGEGNLLYINDQVIPVITGGAPTQGIEARLNATGNQLPGTGSLTGKQWSLTMLGGGTPLKETNITASFGSDGKLAGSAGCNAYSAPYQVRGSQLGIGQIVTTLAACGAVVMQQESNYLQALAGTTSFNVQAETLVLTDASGNELAAFAAKSLVLPGSSWIVTGYSNAEGDFVPVLPGIQINATFGTDGMIGGSAGCNEYFAPYTLNGAKISIGQTASTRATCPKPEGIMTQESAYLLALQAVTSFEMTTETLTLLNADGKTKVSFTPVP